MPLRLYRISKPNSRDVVMRLNEEDAERYGGVPVEDDKPKTRPVKNVELPEPKPEPTPSPEEGRGDDALTKLRHDVSNKARDEY